MSSILKVGLLAGAVALLSGCGALHFYDKGADQLATRAKTDYDGSKVLEALKAEQANYDALDKKQVSAFTNLVAARRDLTLLSLVTDSRQPFAERFKRTVDQRLVEVAGNATQVLAGLDVNTDIDALNKRREVLFSARLGFKQAQSSEARTRANLMSFRPAPEKLLPCEQKNKALFASPEPADRARALGDAAFDLTGMEPTYRSYADACVKTLSSGEALSAAMADWPGAIGQAFGDAAVRAEELARAETAVMEARQALKTATAGVAVAEKARASTQPVDLRCHDDDTATPDDKADVPGKTAIKDEQPNSPGQTLCDAIAALRKWGDAGVKVLSEEQIEAVDVVLAALSGAETTADQKKLPPALALISTVPRLAGAFADYERAKTLPALEPLIIQKQLASSRLAYTTRGHELEKLRVALAREKYDALFLELDLLIQARARIGAIDEPEHKCDPARQKQTPSAYCVPFSALLTPEWQQATTRVGEPPGRVAFRALTYLADSFSAGRARAESAEATLIATEYRDSLNRSEAALAAWDGLISTPINQLQAYHASGITPQEIAQFLQALGVIGIAANVR